MIKISSALCIAVPLICLAIAPVTTRADGDNPLEDAGFESQTAPKNGGWELFGRSQFSNERALRGDTSMLNAGSSGPVPYPPYFEGSVSGSFQEFPATPGSRWRLTGHGLVTTALTGTPAFGIVQVSFFDADGQDLGTVETAGNKTTRAKISNEVNSQSPVDEWLRLDTGIATAPDNTATVQAFTLYVDYSGAKTIQGVYFDELRLCAIAAGAEDCESNNDAADVGAN